MILIAAVAGVISMFLPWWSIDLPFLGSESINGMRDWGLLVFICLLAAGAIAFLGNQATSLPQVNWMAVLIAGGLASLIMVIHLINPPEFVNAAFGFYLTLIASVGVVAFAYLNRTAGDSLQSGIDQLKNRFGGATSPAEQESTTKVINPTNDPSKPVV